MADVSPTSINLYTFYTHCYQVLLSINIMAISPGYRGVILGNFRGRKLSRISQFCGYSRKFALQNFGVWCLWHSKSKLNSIMNSCMIM